MAGTERKCLAMKAELLDTAARAHATSLGRLPLIQAAVAGKCACAKLNVALIYNGSRSGAQKLSDNFEIFVELYNFGASPVPAAVTWTKYFDSS